MSNGPKLFLPKASSAEERPLASFQAEASGEPYQPLSTMADAKRFDDGVVILQGDDGGQIYLVAHAIEVKCSPETLEQLLIDLDEIAWPGNDKNARGIFYERRQIGSPIAGGMGGGVVSEKPWIHKQFSALETAILGVLHGNRARIQ